MFILGIIFIFGSIVLVIKRKVFLKYLLSCNKQSISVQEKFNSQISVALIVKFLIFVVGSLLCLHFYIEKDLIGGVGSIFVCFLSGSFLIMGIRQLKNGFNCLTISERWITQFNQIMLFVCLAFGLEFVIGAGLFIKLLVQKGINIQVSGSILISIVSLFVIGLVAIFIGILSFLKKINFYSYLLNQQPKNFQTQNSTEILILTLGGGVCLLGIILILKGALGFY